MASSADELFAAIETTDLEVATAILERDPATAAARDGEGVSALLRARYRGDRALTAAIEERLDDLDVFEAAAFGRREVLVTLLDGNPALARARAGDGFTPLHLAAFFGGAEAVEVLLTRGAEVDAAGTGWMTGTALHSAASAGRADVVGLLLEAGADPNARQAGGWTALHAAAHHGDAVMALRLVAAGADPTTTDDDGRSPRDLAVASGDADTRAALEA